MVPVADRARGMRSGVMRTITISARISEELEGYGESEKDFIEAVEQGIQAADEGRLIEHEAVVAALERGFRPR
jgi:predicted transcriptional regulator